MAGNQEPKVSVIIPAYNVQDTVASTIESVLAQSRPAHEIIVVNDGSRDGTAEVLSRFGTRIKVIDQNNQGLALARRNAAAASTGDLIAVLDADDLCRPERLAVQVAVLQANPDVVLCASEFSAFNEAGPMEACHSSSYFHMVASARDGYATLLPDKSTLQVVGALSGQDPLEITVFSGDAYRKLAHGNFLQPPTLMFPRRLLNLAGSFESEGGNYASDWDFIVRAAMHGRVAFIDRPLIDYRRSATQISTDANKAKSMLSNILVLKRTCQRDPKLFAECNKELTKQLGAFHLAAADGHSGNDRSTAMRMLLSSVFSYRYVSAETLKVIAKVLLPSSIVSAAKARQTNHKTKNA